MFKRRYLLAVLFSASALALWMTAQTTRTPSPGDTPRGQSIPPRNAPAAVKGLEAGQRGYLDPKTRKPGVPPSEVRGEAMAPGPVAAPGRLREIPGTTPAGGVKVELDGRFQSALTATINGAGEIAYRCTVTKGACSDLHCPQHGEAKPMNPAH